MSKRNKQLQSARYSLLHCERRPVKETDKWCRRGLDSVEDDAPWGYVVTIPFLPDQNTVLENVKGYIVRCKKHRGNLLLQVVKDSFAPKYGVECYSIQESNASILNIRNFRKSEGKW